MGKKLFVGNLAQGVTDGILSKVFGTHGTVASAQVIIDPRTGESRGVGIVEMASDEEARLARRALDLQEVEGRCITVQEARGKSPGGGKRSRH